MSAIISPCGLYRYRLERGLDHVGITVMFLMVNPSTADATINDATIRRCIRRAVSMKAGHLIVGNMFAYRATDVSKLRTAADPVGPENDQHLREMMHEADCIIAGWGSLNKLPEALRGRWKDVVRIADSCINRRSGAPKRLYCLGTTADKQPKHPLFISDDVPVTPWDVPWFANRRAA